MGKLRTITGWVLVVLGCSMLSTFAIVRWTEQQVLDTNNWVATMSALPKNQAVAWSIGTKLVDGIFEKGDITTNLEEVLPPKLEFLAPTISGFLRTKANDLATQIIMSNKFDQIWSDANRTAHQNLVKVLRSPAKSQDAKLLPYKINLAKAQTWLQNAAAKTDNAKLLQAQDTAKDVVAFNASLRRGINQLRAFVRTADSLYMLLPYAVLAAFLAALAVAHKRLKVLMGIGIGISALNVLAIAGVNVLRPALLNSLQDQSYSPIFNVLWTELSQPFLSYARYLVVVGFVVILFALALGHKWFSYLVSVKAKQADWYKSVGQIVRKARTMLIESSSYLYGGGVAIAALVIAFGGFENWQAIARIVLLLVSYLCVIRLITLPFASSAKASK